MGAKNIKFTKKYPIKCAKFNYVKVCPILNTHDKFEESHYLLHQMMKNYHIADFFRFNLNAFIQSLRHTTFMLQSEKIKIKDFENWYILKQEDMKKNILLRRFAEGRKLIVHQRMLKTKSKASVGFFRMRKEKLWFDNDVNPFLDSGVILENIKDKIVGFLIDEEHSDIGEQVGIKRTWIAEELGEQEIVELCYQAFIEMGKIVKEAHNKEDFNFDIPSDCLKLLHPYRVLLETDLDPSLIQKWGWNS